MITTIALKSTRMTMNLLRQTNLMLPSVETYAKVDEIREIVDEMLTYRLSTPMSMKIVYKENVDRLPDEEFGELMEVYNGAGPDGMSKWMRDLITFSLRNFRGPVAIHDWRFTEVAKLKIILDEFKERSPVTKEEFTAALWDWMHVSSEMNVSTLIAELDDVVVVTDEFIDEVLHAAFKDTNLEFYENMKKIVSYCYGYSNSWSSFFSVFKNPVLYSVWWSKARLAYRAVQLGGWSAWMD